MGRGLLCAPFLSTVLATTAILNAGTRRAEAGPAAGDRRRHDDRDPGLLRRRWRHRCGGRRHDGQPFRRHLSARRHQELRARRPHRRPDRRPGAHARHRAATKGLSFFTVAGDAPGLERRLAQDHGRDAQARAAHLQRRRGEAAWARREAAAAPFAKTLQQAAVLPRQRDGRRRRAAARGRARLRQDAHAVRPRDRLLPDDQEQGGRHAGRCRAGEVGGLLRRRGARRGRRRHAGAGVARQGLRRRGLPADRHPRRADAWRHRLHLGQRHASLVQARQELARSCSAMPTSIAS